MMVMNPTEMSRKMRNKESMMNQLIMYRRNTDFSFHVVLMEMH